MRPLSRRETVSGARICLAACALVAACAPQDQGASLPSTVAAGELVDTVCFTSGISGFSELDANRLIIRRSPSESYLVRTGFCPNLKSAEGLKINDPGQCLSRGSRLSVYDTPLPLKGARSDKPDYCLVSEIRRLRETG